MKRQYYIAGVFDMKGRQGYSSGMHMRSQENFNRNSGAPNVRTKGSSGRPKQEEEKL